MNDHAGASAERLPFEQLDKVDLARRFLLLRRAAGHLRAPAVRTPRQPARRGLGSRQRSTVRRLTPAWVAACAIVPPAASTSAAAATDSGFERVTSA